MMAPLTLADIDALTGGKIGTFDLPCPKCGPGRHTPQNRKRAVLRVWRTETGFASYKCARCGLEGYARDANASATRPERVRNAQAEIAAPAEQLRKARFLWSRRQPAEGSPVERYLRQARGYGGPIPASIGYLPPAKPEHHPAMIAAFAWPIDEPEPGLLAILRQLGARHPPDAVATGWFRQSGCGAQQDHVGPLYRNADCAGALE